MTKNIYKVLTQLLLHIVKGTIYSAHVSVSYETNESRKQRHLTTAAIAWNHPDEPISIQTGRIISTDLDVEY